MADLRVTSRQRHDRLTNDEAVALGRALVHASARSHVSFPDDTETAVVIVHECVDELSPEAQRKLVEVIGEFDEERLG